MTRPAEGGEDRDQIPSKEFVMTDEPRRDEAETDDSLQPRKDEREARWQEAAAGEGGQGGEPVTGTLGSAGAGMGADTTEQPDPSRDRFRDLNQS